MPLRHSILDRFEDTVRLNAERVAVEDHEGCLSFEGLRALSLGISDSIRNADRHDPGSGGRERPACRPVGIFLGESVLYVAAIFGILYSGNFYVPLDTRLPAAALGDMADSLGAAFIVTDLDHAPALIRAGVSMARILIVDTGLSYGALSPRPDEGQDAAPRILDTDPVYMMHTSGSTGHPNAVVIQERALADYAIWVGKTFGMTRDTVMGCLNSFSFDNSILEIFSMAFFGSRLSLLHGEYRRGHAEALIAAIKGRGVDFIFWVPSILVGLAGIDAFARERPEALKKILFCGEVMPNRHLNYWRRHLPEALYANLYGPTEITDVCAYYIVDRNFDDSDPLPIGRARDNMEILLLDGEGKGVGPGQTGEIHVRGTALAAGYWRSPEATARAFIQNPLNPDYPETVYRTGDLASRNERGELLFLGRRDSQIKHYGTRVELAGLESVAYGLAGMEEACALHFQAEKKIALAYRSRSALDRANLIGFMKARLSVYPTEYIRFDDFPHTPNGKVDRIALKGLVAEALGFRR